MPTQRKDTELGGVAAGADVEKKNCGFGAGGGPQKKRGWANQDWGGKSHLSDKAA